MSTRTFKSGGNSSGTFNTSNVVFFDDFISLLESSSGADTYYISGNFGIFSGSSISSEEQNHPGIISLETTSDEIKGFTELGANGTIISRLLTYENDFDITFLTRLRYSGGNDWDVTYRLDGGPGILVEIDGVNGVRYDVGGGLVITAVPIPANNDWVQLRFQLVAGNLTVTLDGNTVFNGAIAHTGGFGIRAEVQTATDLDGLDIDYVLTNYTVTR